MGLFTSRERILQFSHRRVAFLAMSVAGFVVTEVVRRGLRPGLRGDGGLPLVLANSIGNLGGVVVQIFFGLALLNPTRTQALRVVAFMTCGYIAYEFLQPVLPRGTFDWHDVYGTLVGGLVIAVPLVLLLWRLLPEDSRPGAGASS